MKQCYLIAINGDWKHYIFPGILLNDWYKAYLLRDADVRIFSPCLVNDIDVIEEDVLQAASKIWYGGQVRHIFLYDTSYI